MKQVTTTYFQSLFPKTNFHACFIPLRGLGR